MATYAPAFLIDIICCQRIIPTGKKAKQKLAGDDVMMSEAQDEMMAESQTQDSEQWSLYEVLTPLAEKIIQDSVIHLRNLVIIVPLILVFLML